MRSALAALLSLPLLLAPRVATAGDCPAHPVTLMEVEVVSCAPLDAANAPRVVDFEGLLRGSGMTRAALDKEVAGLVAQKAAVLLEVHVARTRLIQVDGRIKRGTDPLADSWAEAKDSATRWLVYRTPDAGVCTRLAPKSKPTLAHFTDCSCDTGPQGWCAVNRDAFVAEVPARLSRFVAREDP
jgi:hypothetical protein